MNVPQLRFDGFDREWELKSLSEVVTLFGGNAFQSKDATNSGVKWLKIANVSFGEMSWRDTSFLPYEYIGKYKKYLLLEGDIVMALTRPIIEGKLKIAILGKEDVPSLLNQRVAKLVCTENTNEKFIYQLLRKRKIVAEIESLISGTDPPNIGNSEMKKVDILLPLQAEQEKIAIFLTLLDKKVIMQQEKVEKLEQFKKSMMQKIFSQELRFKDEDDGKFPEWESKNLMELGEFKRSYSYSRTHEGLGDYQHIHYGDIHTKLSTIINKNTYLPSISVESDLEIIEAGEVIFADASEDYKDLGKAVVVKETDDRKIISGLHTHRFEPAEQLDPTFLMYFTKTKEYLAFIRMFGTGVSVLGISKNNLGMLEVPLPSIEEQQKISDYLSTIDSKIEKEKEKLIVLEEQKKGFMQGIFV